jgi:hypothetical protein
MEAYMIGQILDPKKKETDPILPTIYERWRATPVLLFLPVQLAALCPGYPTSLPLLSALSLTAVMFIIIYHRIQSSDTTIT